MEKSSLNLLEKALIKKAEKLKKRPKRRIIFKPELLSFYGWHVSIPALIGIIIGSFLDTYYPVPYISWKLNFILLGFFVGFIAANSWLKRSGIIHNKKERK